MDDNELLALAQLLDSRMQYERKNPIYFVKLNKPQQKFMAMTSRTRKDLLPRRLIFIGANKLGKTCMGTLRGIALATGEHPFLPEDHPFRKIPNWHLPSTGLVVGEQLSQSVDKKLVPEYKNWLPEICEPDFKKNPQGVVTKIVVNQDMQGNPLGSVIHFRSWDMKVESFEGIDMDWIHWDEPPNYAHFVAAERGLLPTDGISYMTFTSLKEPWIKDFADRSIDYGGTDEGIRVVEGGDIWQNSIDNGGILTESAISDFIKIVPKEDYPARVEGQWMRSGSIIYSSFEDRSPYVVPPFKIPDHWPRIESLDPHDSKDSKWLFGAVSPYDYDLEGEKVHRIFIYDYINLNKNLTISEMVREVRQKRLDLGYTDKSLIGIVVDAKYGRRTSKQVGDEPETWQDKLESADAGYIILSDSKPGSVELGHKIVKAYLIPQFWKMYEKDIPGIVFTENCRGIDSPIEAMMKYRYKPDSDKPEEDYKDWADCVRYMASYRPRYIERGSLRPRVQQPRNKYTGR